MDKEKELSNHPDLLNQYIELNRLNVFLESKYLESLNRSLPFADHLNDRWERAKRLGFGEGTSIYDSSYVIGEVKVGKNCWIGMNTLLDGSGNLVIGDCCTISAGVHIYTHDNLKATLSSNRLPIEREAVIIGNNCYIAPHSILAKGVQLGKSVVIAAHSFVNKSFPDFAIVAGIPAKQIGEVELNDTEIFFKYYK